MLTNPTYGQVLLTWLVRTLDILMTSIHQQPERWRGAGHSGTRHSTKSTDVGITDIITANTVTRQTSHFYQRYPDIIIYLISTQFNIFERVEIQYAL